MEIPGGINLSSFYRRGYKGTNMVSNLPKISRAHEGWSRYCTHILWLWNLHFNPHMSLNLGRVHEYYKDLATETMADDRTPRQWVRWDELRMQHQIQVQSAEERSLGKELLIMMWNVGENLGKWSVAEAKGIESQVISSVICSSMIW